MKNKKPLCTTTMALVFKFTWLNSLAAALSEPLSGNQSYEKSWNRNRKVSSWIFFALVKGSYKVTNALKFVMWRLQMSEKFLSGRKIPKKQKHIQSEEKKIF